MDHDPLAVDPETMRRLGYQTVDWLVERAGRRSDEPVLEEISPQAIAARVPDAVPRTGVGLEAILGQLGADVLPFRSRIDHPRYLAYVPGEGTWLGALGDLVASTYNIDVGNWMESAGPSHLEDTVLGWFAEWIGYPSEAAGVLVSGGSAANLTAMACAREALVGAMNEDLVAYVSEQGHSSLARAARVLGFRPQQVRVLPVDGRHRMRVDALEAAIRADLAAGRRPLVVLAVAGTTNTGAVDDLPEISRTCREHGVWLHVDGAYGAFAVLTEKGREALTGLDLADSVTLDPHKWLYQPFECGALLVRQGHLLREAFEIHPSYLQDTASRNGEVNFADHGLQLTRMSRAVKVWMSLQYFGVDAFAEAVDRAMSIARHVEEYVDSSTELELLSPATLGIVCLRRHPPGQDDESELERLNAAVVAALAASGEGLVSSTRLLGRYAVRVCVLNHSTTRDDVDRVLHWLETAPLPDAGTEPDGALATTTADLTRGWPGAVAADVEELRSLSLLDGLGEERLRWVASVVRRRQVGAGDTVVRQWDVDRDFYLLLEGEADVLSGGRQLTTLGPGDFFGELAALDWGASFGYPRLADVLARTDLLLLVLTDAELSELMATAPEVDARVRATAAERATRL
jgi:aromatic-L-amino-acid/L-tryptophan decarboxylase